VAAGRLEDMRQRIQTQRVARVGLMRPQPERVEQAQAWLAGRPDVAHVGPASNVVAMAEGDLLVTFSGEDEALARLLSDMVGAGFQVVTFREETGDLEDVFLQLTKGVVS